MRVSVDADFELALFHTTLPFDQQAVAAGVPTLVVDWEYRGKHERQLQYDTQINRHTLEDLQIARTIQTARIICRLNSFGSGTQHEVEASIDSGADEILLPMVRKIAELEATLRYAAERCGVGIMVETTEAVQFATRLDQWPLARVYVGLHDLSIERRERHIFVPLADGTVDKIRRSIRHHRFGFAGLTVPQKGSPLPCSTLVGEMARLDCHFAFLRRSFIRDIQGQDLASGVSSILEAMRVARRRTPQQIASEHDKAVRRIQQLPNGPWAI